MPHSDSSAESGIYTETSQLLAAYGGGPLSNTDDHIRLLSPSGEKEIMIMDDEERGDDDDPHWRETGS